MTMTSELEIKFPTDDNLTISNFDQNEEFVRKLYDSLITGKIENSLHLYQEYAGEFQSEEFVEKIFKPTIYKINEDFDSNKISTAVYRVAKNISTILAKIIFES